MSRFSVSVDHYMISPVLSVKPDANLSDVDTLMRENDVSSVAVVGDSLQGIVSRTDLLSAGRRQAGTRGKAALLTFPESLDARAVMTPGVETVTSATSCAAAAKLMVDKRIHRLFVQDDGELLGVLSPYDLMRAIMDARVNKPISTFMSSPLFKVRVEEPISLATERLEKAKVTGLIVVEGEFAVGLFTQREALDSSEVARDTPVENVMSPALILLESSTPIHRAAAMAATLGVRRVVATENQVAKGILTGLDFAKAVAG